MALSFTLDQSRARQPDCREVWTQDPEPKGFAGTTILLATFNGEAFLPAQLQSLAQQTDTAWRLLVRDDGSTDATREILTAFATRQGRGSVRILEDGAGRLGVLGSFMALLAAAPCSARYAFCDQDDVWRPEKLARAAAAMADSPPSTPTLYCARQQIVDSTLHPLGLSPDIAREPGFGNALVQNIATGCTIVMNHAARHAVLAEAPPPNTLHDWWSYLTVSGAGGRVIFDPEPVVLYRQHRANAVGATPNTLRRAAYAMLRGPQPLLEQMMAQAHALEAHPALTADARDAVAHITSLPRAGRLNRLAALRRAGVYRQRIVEHLLLHLWVALGRPPGRSA